jgi:hypothetical protein
VDTSGYKNDAKHTFSLRPFTKEEHYQLGEDEYRYFFELTNMFSYVYLTSDSEPDIDMYDHQMGKVALPWKLYPHSDAVTAESGATMNEDYYDDSSNLAITTYGKALTYDELPDTHQYLAKCEIYIPSRVSQCNFRTRFVMAFKKVDDVTGEATNYFQEFYIPPQNMYYSETPLDYGHDIDGNYPISIGGVKYEYKDFLPHDEEIDDDGTDATPTHSMHQFLLSRNTYHEYIFKIFGNGSALTQEHYPNNSNGKLDQNYGYSSTHRVTDALWNRSQMVYELK